MLSLIGAIVNTSMIQGTVANLGILFARVSIGLMMLLAHGYGKLANYSVYAEKFGDPIGLGSTTSLVLAIFAEFFCSIAVIFGFMTRLAAIPLLTTMLVASLIVHASDPWQRQEFALLYAFMYVTLILVGSGKYSIDALISRKIEEQPTSSAAKI